MSLAKVKNFNAINIILKYTGDVTISICPRICFSVFWTDVNAENEFIKNFEEYLLPLLEYQQVSNMSAFVDSIEDFYFNGNVTSNLKNNITEVRLRINRASEVKEI